MVKNYYLALGLDYLKANELPGGSKLQNTLDSQYKLIKGTLSTMTDGGEDLANIDRKELSDAVNILQGELDEAYDILSDQKKREKYLLQLEKAVEGQEIFEKSRIVEVMNYASQVQGNSD